MWPDSNGRSFRCKRNAVPGSATHPNLVGLAGFEPVTSASSKQRTTGLFYNPDVPAGIWTLDLRIEGPPSLSGLDYRNDVPTGIWTQGLQAENLS